MPPERCSLISAEQVVSQARVVGPALFLFERERVWPEWDQFLFLVYELFFLSCQILISIASNKFIKKSQNINTLCYWGHIRYIIIYNYISVKAILSCKQEAHKADSSDVCQRKMPLHALTLTKSISSLFSMKFQILGFTSSHIPPRSLSTPSSWKVLLTWKTHQR